MLTTFGYNLESASLRLPEGARIMNGSHPACTSSRPRRLWPLIWAVSALAMSSGLPRSASATPILNLVTTGSLAMTQGNTGTLGITVTNTGTSPIDLAGMTIGLQLVPDGAVTGSLDLSDFLATDTPWTNPTTVPPVLELLTLGQLNDSSNYFLMSISGNYTLAASGTAVLGTVQFTASGDAVGTWQLWAVNEWPDEGFPISFVDDDQFETFQFTDLSRDEGDPLGVTLQIGTITVAVPEPSTWALLSVGGILAGGMRLARRRV
jgi:hypothetical protein